ncbi:MAG: nucleoside triphosphate pyrophosphohydrolase [Bernardetiaceae bacterium]|nr:nucleoside triphosphate pyrophosphohydrolase [Bernardetiaceae bacterium]
MIDPNAPKYAEALARILQIMNELREGCPWDRQQTMESLRHLNIEDVFELSDAILSKDAEEIKKELGDVLLHIVFYAKIADEQSHFDLSDVIHSLCDKLIRRHPHIYSNTIAEDEQAVKRNWEQLKLAEKGKDGKPKSVLDGVPRSLPALIKAIRIQEKARSAGFDWDEPHQVWEKVKEELAEFEEQAEKPEVNEDELEGEFGDLLFSLINYARFKNINPETALEKTNRKFIRRFNYIEAQAQLNGQKLEDMSLEDMDIYWNEAKTL